MVKTIDSEGKIEKIEFYNLKGNIHKQGSMNDNNKIQINKEYIYDKNDKMGVSLVLVAVEIEQFDRDQLLNEGVRRFRNCRQRFYEQTKQR